MDVSEIDNTLLDDTIKGIPGGTPPFRLGDIGQKGWNILREDLALPVVAICQSALERNRLWMRRLLAQQGSLHAPHGKTLVSPQIYSKELEDGAWGLTVATIYQLQVYRHFGAKRILYANQLVGRAGINYVLDELAADPEFEFFCLVDSVACLQILADAVRWRRLGRPINLLLEIGYAGGRAGCRDSEEALSVARAIAAQHPGFMLCGVEIYAGTIDELSMAESVPRIREVLAKAAHVARLCEQEGLFKTREVIFCAGCSHYFDLAPAAAEMVGMADRLRVIVRSGCYLYFDSRWYAERFLATFDRIKRLKNRTPTPEASIEMWGYVLSLPETRLAICGIGRRETSFAFGLPVPLKWFRPGIHEQPHPLSTEYRVTALNDHHAFLELPSDSPLRCGDMICLGISVPTATFDRWQLIFLVDDSYQIVRALRNFL